MAAQRRSLLKLNLLISQTHQPKIYIRLLKWLIASGRYIIIIVEFMVIAGFVARFKLDADLLDLQDKIKLQIPYIESLKSDEILIRQTQFQLATIRQVKDESLDYAQILIKIASLTPQNIKLTNINLNKLPNLNKATIQITGQSPSNQEISLLIKTLKKEPQFSEISLTNLTFEQPVIVFTIGGSFSPNQNIKSN